MEELFIDGTKLEANANQYTFVWCSSINYHLAGLLDSIDALYQKSNNTMIEIDACSPLEIRKLQAVPSKSAEDEGIAFIAGKGKHKPQLPRRNAGRG